MSIQNVISATLSEADKNDILNKLASIRGQLNFLITLDAAQIKGLFKAGNGYSAFINKANSAAASHPDILPRVFSVEEFVKDCALIEALTPIQNQMNELAKGVQDTLTAAHSDALVQALEVYAAVKQHQDKVPGLATTCEELSVFFQHSSRKHPKAA